MDPTYEVGKEIVKIAVDLARQYHEKAREQKATDIEKMCNYMAMARVTVRGLVQERDAILTEASILGVMDLKDQRTNRLLACALRLHIYMNERRLVPNLDLAIQGMEKYRDVLSNYLPGVLSWVFASDVEKKTALADVQDLLGQLNLFRERLKYKEKPSGVGLTHLKDLEIAIKHDRNSEILAAVSNARDADDDECRGIELRLDLISSNLSIAFR